MKGDDLDRARQISAAHVKWEFLVNAEGSNIESWMVVYGES